MIQGKSLTRGPSRSGRFGWGRADGRRGHAGRPALAQQSYFPFQCERCGGAVSLRAGRARFACRDSQRLITPTFSLASDPVLGQK